MIKIGLYINTTRMQNNKTHNDERIQYTQNINTIILHNLQGQN